MPRGIVPRQPSKAGRHEGARSGPPPRAASARDGVEKSRRGFTRGASRETPPKRKPNAWPAAPPKKPAKAPGYNPVAPARVQAILNRLDQTYPEVTCALHHKNAWELLVATILSAQCTDERVNKTTPELFAKYPTPADFAHLRPEQLEPDIRSTGFFRNKSKSVVGAAKKILSDFGGQVPDTMEALLTLPGVARKTANVVLGTWFRKNEGVVVDTHVYRVSRRLELTSQTDPNKIEQDLIRIIPREKWALFAHQLIWHGRRLCVARQPKCADCPLENICHAADKTWSTVDVHRNAKP